MLEPQHHEMRLETIYSSGVEEWLCPTCGRHFVAQWIPDFRRLVLEVGDETALHQGGAVMIQTTASVEDDPPIGAERDDPWVKWLDELDWGDDTTNFEN